MKNIKCWVYVWYYTDIIMQDLESGIVWFNRCSPAQARTLTHQELCAIISELHTNLQRQLNDKN